MAQSEYNSFFQELPIAQNLVVGQFEKSNTQSSVTPGLTR